MIFGDKAYSNRRDTEVSAVMSAKYETKRGSAFQKEIIPTVSMAIAYVMTGCLSAWTADQCQKELRYKVKT